MEITIENLGDSEILKSVIVDLANRVKALESKPEVVMPKQEPVVDQISKVTRSGKGGR